MVAKQLGDATTIGVNRGLRNQSSLKAPLSPPALRGAVAQDEPRIAIFDQRVITDPSAETA
jgi:hypothetical protein